ncbi:MAG: hypothetical protein AB7F22_35450, partial [Reyranella sp.]|uniref:hypothetical protein n=1 Tax=Reyranella sp. TaxID=1929291 RepID=UPI003D0D4A4E
MWDGKIGIIQAFLPSFAGEVSPSYGDLPSPKRSRFGFAQAGGRVMILGPRACRPHMIMNNIGRDARGPKSHDPTVHD